MKNNTKIGIGVLALAGVGYYFYNKSKSPMTNVTTTNVNEPKKTGFDREKASRELAVLIFSKMMKPIDKELIKPTSQATSQATSQGTSQGTSQAYNVREEAIIQAQRNEAMRQSMELKNVRPTELSLYKKILEGLTEITDDSDAEFIFNLLKKYFEVGDKNFKPDLDTQIRIDKIQQKYPIALKKLDFGS